MNSNLIIETLYKKYYSGDGSYEVTSSYWREYREKVTVIRENDDFVFKAEGCISAYHRKSLLSKLKHLPVDFLLTGLLTKHNATKNAVSAAKDITSQLNIHFDFDHAKHVLSCDLIDSYGLFNTPYLICIIGDGHGFLSTLIKTIYTEAKILVINLGRNLLIDVICFSRIFPDVEPLYIHKPEDCKLIDNKSIIFLEAEHFELMKKLPISLFINIASMQEMDMPVIEKYFDYMRASTVEAHFYCCNREEKTLPDGSIIRFVDYPWGGVFSR